MDTVSPAVIRGVVKELKKMENNKVEGVTVLPSDEDLTEINAIIEGPAETPFMGGRFRVKLKLGAEYPQAPPKGTFLTKIFHPNVSAKGEICVNTLKKDWKSTMGIEHVLLTIKCLLLVPNAESALNEEAGKLLLENYEDYCKHAKLMTSVHAIPKGSKKEEKKEKNEGNVVKKTTNKENAQQETAGKSEVKKKKDKVGAKKRSLKRL